MAQWKAFAFCALTLVLLSSASLAPAQVSVGIGIGAAPVCPYGYFDYTPYPCAPYGYYGPEWFNGGVFIGAGQWFHGPENFQGHVNNSYHPDHGYKGETPARGEKARPENDVAHNSSFKGNETRDGHGHATAAGDDEHKR